ncbi:MAG TPA: hypothetical protein VGC74_15495 [Stenotrophomonas sp.]|jgi:hypothetical protein
MPSPARALLLLCCLACASWSGAALAQSGIHRCTGPDGQTVYSDRRCEDLGAMSRMPPPALRNGETGLYRYGCPRRLSELVGLLRTAIETHDVNRLSSLYLWNDIGDPAANRILTQLEAISSRPLLDIAPLYPDYAEETYSRAPVAPPDTTGAPTAPDAARLANVSMSAAPSQTALASDTAPLSEAGAAVAEGQAQPVPARPRPWGLRLEQVLANGSTPSQATLRLRRQYNCFWVSF